MDDRLITTLAIVDLHVLYSSRSLSDCEVFEERRSLDSAPITSEVMATALELQHALLWTATSPDSRSRHLLRRQTCWTRRAPLLRYFAPIAEVGGAEHEWVVPRGSI